MEKVLLSVAPVDATDTVINPEKIAADVLECAKAGAGMVHLHVRDSQGNLTSDMTVFKQIVARIRQQSDIIIQASTGGISKLTIEERCVPIFDDEVESVSLNVGSVNLGDAVYQNPAQDVKYCVERIIDVGRTPEVEVFEIGMIETAMQLYNTHKFRDPLLFAIVLGHIGAAPATVEALVAMKNFIPDHMTWGLTHAHRKNNVLVSAALAMGAKAIRVGFEDSHIIENGIAADTNAPIVAEIASIIRQMGKETMTPKEARKFFNIQ